MSGDVQPRKRKDKRKKKGSLDARRSEEYSEESAIFQRQSSAASDEEVEFLQHHGSIGGSDEVIHVHKESKLGGNICSKIVFFGLLGALGVMVGLIIIEFHGTNDVDIQSAANSPWSMILEGWVDSSSGHDDHDEHTEHDDEHSEHDDEHEDHEDEHNKQHEGEYFEGGEHEHEEEEEEEPIEEVEEVSFVQQTYDDLRAAYNQLTPDESEAELTEDTNAQLHDYEATESEPEPSETEEEEDDEEPQEDDPLGQWKSESGPELLAEGLDEVQTEEGTDEEETEEESEDEASAAPASGGPKSAETDEDQIFQDFVSDEAVEPTVVLNGPESKEELYENSDITNQADWEFREDLDEADRQLDEGNPSSALSAHSVLLSRSPRSPRALYGRARALDRLAEVERSNARLLQAISAYSDALRAPDLPSALLIRIANRTIDRMRFKGVYAQAIEVHNLLIERFPNNITHQIDLGVTYLTLNRLDRARSVLEAAHLRWPEHALCRGYLGLSLKLQGLHTPSVPHLNVTVYSDHPGTDDSRFYFHLGDALQRLRKNDDAMKIYEVGVEKGIFRSKYQRSLYNVERLKAQPWWTLDETTYKDFFRKLEAKWKVIKSEGLSVYKERQGYLDEAESLRDSGDWKQFELFSRGQKYKQNCARTPVTCGMIEELAAARTCRRGQVKFSVMTGGTHVWPHCGPTNCRLRAHLGLSVPPGTALTVAGQTRTWEEGKVIVFDDSFEHEVWHNGSAPRLVLIVDVWHPELTTRERATLSAI